MQGCHKGKRTNLLKWPIFRQTKKKTNFVGRNLGHFNKFALLPLCRPCRRDPASTSPFDLCVVWTSAFRRFMNLSFQEKYSLKNTTSNNFISVVGFEGLSATGGLSPKIFDLRRIRTGWTFKPHHFPWQSL